MIHKFLLLMALGVLTLTAGAAEFSPVTISLDNATPGCLTVILPDGCVWDSTVEYAVTSDGVQVPIGYSHKDSRLFIPNPPTAAMLSGLRIAGGCAVVTVESCNGATVKAEVHYE